MPEKNANRLQQLWYSGTYWYLLLAPFSAIFAMLTSLRRALFRQGILKSTRIAVPIVVVGNISVGGTGKTPVTIWLAEQLRRRGFHPGVVSRGYGGVVGKQPVQANASSDPDIVGDEPLLIARRSKVPVVVHPDRVAAASELVKIGVDVIIADDGLQHYRLQRDYEIAVVDAARGFGNGWLLPAGPLRELKSRLNSVNKVLLHQVAKSPQQKPLPGLTLLQTGSFHLVNHNVVRLDEKETRSFDEFRGTRVHAVAAIGNPERFFAALEQRGLELVRHAFPDHAQLTARDLAFDDQHDIIMTEKDAVKCREFGNARTWYVPVDVDMHDEHWLDDLENQLRVSGKVQSA